MTTIPKVIPLNLQKVRDPIGRSFCIKGMSSATPLYSLEDRPIESGDRCISAELEGQRFGLCLSPLLLIEKVVKKVKAETATMILVTPN